MTNRVYIVEHGMLHNTWSIIGVYEDLETAKNVATGRLDEKTIKETHSAPVNDQFSWEDDKFYGACVNGYWIE